ncbi:sensor domain-containing diguanylate cyclase [Agrobacterium vitis]|uniref:Diguanylate cyclase n=1 Tax=Agrobacterium vitis TaxID=373 RepID=A0AAE2R7W1_AGRVI|nr:sensor domain-containing diguanylate cyclase [Agrobacterium vitis]MBF2713243.1 diguanylate cyclase [Agrobacterium vitis]
MDSLDHILKLDFITLFVVIGLLSLALTAIWGAIAWQHRGFDAARIWFCGCLAQAAGGICLLFQQGPQAPIVAAIANGFVIFGFWLFWAGVRRFHGKTTGLAVPIGISALCAGLTIALYSSHELIALLYALGQSAPMVAILMFLLGLKRRSVGAWISNVGLTIAILSHAIVVAMNVTILSSSGPVPDWSAAAALTMLGVMFSGLLLNFGLAVMTIDRLRGELTELANTDPLTGVLNRRGFEVWLASGVQEATSVHGILLFDLNDFKQINDRFGHKAGDDILVHFTRIVATLIGDRDMLVRSGGDEFIVLVPGADDHDCAKLAATINTTLAASPLLANGRQVHVSASIGTALWRHDHVMSVDEAFAQADAAMYAVKANRTRQTWTDEAEPRSKYGSSLGLAAQNS